MRLPCLMHKLTEDVKSMKNVRSSYGEIDQPANVASIAIRI